MTAFVHFGMIMLDICALLCVVLIVDALFGIKLKYNNHKLAICCAGFFVMKIFAEFVMKWDNTLLLICICFWLCFSLQK